MSAGNHDYITPDSQLWDRFKKESDEHVLVLDKKEPLELSAFESKIVVYPAPCHAKHSAEHATGWVKDVEKEPDAIHIGIAHGSIEGVSPDFDQRYYPHDDSLNWNDSRVDLWPPRHTASSPGRRQPDKRDIIFNPGTPEPDRHFPVHMKAAHSSTPLVAKRISNPETPSVPVLTVLSNKQNGFQPQKMFPKLIARIHRLIPWKILVSLKS
ncbi:MAG: hypothetical protein U5K72_15965 [Balneolaceae bacterium]|nr:hypothetical protein [Balneolaceae bacterium]